MKRTAQDGFRSHETAISPGCYDSAINPHRGQLPDLYLLLLGSILLPGLLLLSCALFAQSEEATTGRPAGEAATDMQLNGPVELGLRPADPLQFCVSPHPLITTGVGADVSTYTVISELDHRPPRSALRH